MPDVVRLRYIGAQPVFSAVLGRDVEPDCIIDVPGVAEEHDDCYIIDPGTDQVRAWPKTQWRNETVKRTRKTTEE